MRDSPEESSTPIKQTALKDVKVGGNLVVGNITQIGTVIQQALLPNKIQQEFEARHDLLRCIRSDVEVLLKQSLYENEKIALSKELRSRMVESRRAQGIVRALPKSETVPSAKRMIDIFNEASQRLLILGVPGAGKTIALLELALQLIEHAEAKLNEPDTLEAPIPVLLNLATWKADHQSINYWIIEELKSKYGVPKDLGRRWLKKRQLLPLLDELDRLSTDHQEVCIEAINNLLQQENHPTGLVVCSRLEEYQSHSTKFKLEEAICIKSLSQSQIHEYLTKSIGHAELWQNIREDSTLLECVKSPLFLSILVWTLAPQQTFRQQEIVTEEWDQCKTIQEKRQYFFKIFIEQMLDREIINQYYLKSKEPHSNETRRWLIQLAKIVKEKSPTDFLIEDMQPDWWFSTEVEERTYRLIVRLIFGLVAGFTAGLYLYGWSHQLIVFIFAILAGLATGVLSHFFSLVSGERSIFFLRLLESFLPGLIFFILMFILIYLMPIVMPIDSVINWSWLILLTSIGVGSASYGLLPKHIKVVDKVEFSLGRAMRYTSFGLALGMIFIPVHFLLQPEFYDQNLKYAAFELFAFFLSGLLAGVAPGKAIKIDLKRTPNQGIRRTRKYSTIWFVFGSLIGAFFTIEMDGFETVRSTCIALAAGIFASLMCSSNSGLVCIKHFVLRCILYRKKYTPWNYARFLNYATERKLLQRVGGRYKFWHDFLREHFSKMSLESVEQPFM